MGAPLVGARRSIRWAEIVAQWAATRAAPTQPDCIDCMPVAQKNGQLSACDMAEMLQYLPVLDNPALRGLWASKRNCEIVEEPVT